jgi:predicted dehydrogenase
VRGNWRNEAESCFSLLAKSCHDIDWLRFVVGSRACRASRPSARCSTFARRSSPPPRSGAAALPGLSDPVRDSCQYSATRIYLDDAQKRRHHALDASVICRRRRADGGATSRRRCATGPYGRCAFRCDNDVCDNQVVNLEFESGATASFTMIAFSQDVCVRRTRVFGTEGQLECVDGRRIVLQRFGEPEQVVPFGTAPPGALSGHGGADFFLAQSFVRAMRENNSRADSDRRRRHARVASRAVFAAEQRAPRGLGGHAVSSRLDAARNAKRAVRPVAASAGGEQRAVVRAPSGCARRNMRRSRSDRRRARCRRR